MDELDQWLRDMEKAVDTLADPRTFFDHHRDRYLDIAQNTAVQVLNAMRPDSLDADLWRENTVDFAELMFTSPIRNGLAIHFAHRTELETMAARNRGQNPANFTPISYQDVLEWVLAGPENGGKDPSEIEITRDRSPYNIAYDVHQAIVQHRLGTERKDFSRITRRLEDWVNTRLLSGDMDEMLRAIVEAWQTLLAPVIERDYLDWMDDVLRN